MGKRALTSGVERPEYEADHCPQTTAEIGMIGAVPPLSQCFHGVVLN